ncbi:hypothetical protein KBB49_04220 [Candidatus Saccharibacteria bacterium]|nr:hypothetical protein [Candidatus Saccharibacteria bacterium]
MPDKLISKIELLETLLLSGLFILLFNIDVFIRFLSGQGSSYNYFNEKLREYIDTPLDWLSENLFTAGITTFILWAIFGIICYSVLYFFIDVESEVTDTLEIGDDYVHPAYENANIYRHVLLKNTFILLGTTALIVLVLTLAFKIFIPFMSTNILLALYDSANMISTVWYILLAYIAIVIIPITIIAILKANMFLRFKVKS